MVTSYLAVVNQLLKTYETDEIVTETQEELRCFSKLSHQSVYDCSDALLTKELRMG